jgi:hypothetical protein
MLRASPRNPDVFEIVSMPEPSWKLNIHSVGHWWKLDRLEMPKQTKQCVHNIPCDRGRRYIGETSRPLNVLIKEHKHNLIKKSKLTQHAYEKGYKIHVCWKWAKVLQIEPNTSHRKYKESAHTSLVDHPIDQPSLDTLPVLAPFIAKEVRKLQLRPVKIMCGNCVFILVPYRKFLSLVMTSLLTVLWF